MKSLLLLLSAVLILVLGCQRKPEPFPSARPPSVPARLPAGYDSLPQLLQLSYTIGERTYLLIAVPATSEEAWLPCVVDSIVVLVSTPADSVYAPYRTLRDEVEGSCLSHPENEEAPAVLIEPIAGGKQHVLILHLWDGGNSLDAFRTEVWTFPELKPAASLSASDIVRLSPDSVLVAISHTSFMPDDDLDVPRALYASVVATFAVLEPGVDSARVEELWRLFAEEQRQRALRTYDSILQHHRPDDYEGPLVWSAIDYIVFSRSLNKGSEARAFFRREQPRLQRLLQDSALVAYIRSALTSPTASQVLRYAVFSRASNGFLSHGNMHIPYAAGYSAHRH